MTQTFSDDSGLWKALAAAIETSTSRPCFVVEVPANAGASVPYTVLDPMPGQWDRGLFMQEHACGWFGFQLRAIGRGEDKDGVADYAWLAGKHRAAIDVLALSGDGWSAGSAFSQGTPSGADTAGRLTAVAETFEIYVQTA